MTEAISILVEKLESADPALVAAAAQSLAQANESIEAAAVPLIQRVGTLDEDSNEWVVSALEQLEMPRLEDAPQLAQMIQAFLDRQANSQQAYWAATLLGRIGAEASHASCQMLAKCASEADEPEIVTRSTWALSQFGAAAAPAHAILEQLRNSQVPRTARYAQQALTHIAQANPSV